LRSNTASIQLAQCTASSFAASRSGARPTSWRRDEAQPRPHRVLVCAPPTYTDPAWLHLFPDPEFSALQVDEQTYHDGRPNRILVYLLPSYTDPAKLHLLFWHGDQSRPVSWQGDEPRPQNPPPSGVCATKLLRSGEVAPSFSASRSGGRPCKLTKRWTTTADPIAFWCVRYQCRLHLLSPHWDWALASESRRGDELRPQTPPPSGVCATKLLRSGEAAPSFYASRSGGRRCKLTKRWTTTADPIAFWYVLYQCRLHLFPQRDWALPPTCRRRDEPRPHTPPPSGVARYQATSIRPAHSGAPDRSPYCTLLFALLHLHRYLVKDGGVSRRWCHLAPVHTSTLRTSSQSHGVSQRVIRATLPLSRKR
jgi:hypothetical protein